MTTVYKNHYAVCRAYSLDMSLVESNEGKWSVVLVCDRGGQNKTKMVRVFDTKEQATEYYNKTLHVCTVQGLSITEK